MSEPEGERIPVDMDDEESYQPVFDEGFYYPWEDDSQ